MIFNTLPYLNSLCWPWIFFIAYLAFVEVYRAIMSHSCVNSLFIWTFLVSFVACLAISVELEWVTNASNSLSSDVFGGSVNRVRVKWYWKSSSEVLERRLTRFVTRLAIFLRKLLRVVCFHLRFWAGGYALWRKRTRLIWWRECPDEFVCWEIGCWEIVSWRIRMQC